MKGVPFDGSCICQCDSILCPHCFWVASLSHHEQESVIRNSLSLGVVPSSPRMNPAEHQPLERSSS